MTDPAALRARLDSVRDRIARAARRAGRDPSSVRLVAISKTFLADDVRAVAGAGQIDFGENKVQEALQKMSETSGLPLTWHLVGHLQSNKTRKAGAAFDVVHSVDDAALVAKLDDAAAAHIHSVADNPGHAAKFRGLALEDAIVGGRAAVPCEINYRTTKNDGGGKDHAGTQQVP